MIYDTGNERCVDGREGWEERYSHGHACLRWPVWPGLKDPHAPFCATILTLPTGPTVSPPSSLNKASRSENVQTCGR